MYRYRGCYARTEQSRAGSRSVFRARGAGARLAWLRSLLPALLSAAIPYGGQAAIEGVMMKGRGFAALAVRRRDGRIEVLERVVTSRFPGLANTPLIRGIVIMIDMFTLGTWALRESQHRFELDMIAADEEKRAEAAGTVPVAQPLPAAAQHSEEAPKPTFLQNLVMIVALLISLVMFKVLPAIAATYIFGWLGLGGNISTGPRFSMGFSSEPTLLLQFVANAIEGLIKFGIFVGYIWAIGRLAEIRRLFEYHGAEHIVINAYEDDASNQDMRFIQSHGVAHPRCGTSFIAIVILSSIFLFTLVDWAIVKYLPQFVDTARHIPIWYIRWPLRIIGLLPVAGLSYEIIRAAFKYYSNPLLRPLLRFGMLFQVLTVRRPQDEQVEVSLASFNRARYLSEGIPEPKTHG